MIVNWKKYHLIVISFMLGLMTKFNVNAALNSQTEGDNSNNVRAFESPRVDYNNEWRPVGRGDPLKNDPTFDYSPPALDRVRYWAENTANDKDIKKESSLNTNNNNESQSDRVRQSPNSISSTKNEKQIHSHSGANQQQMRYTSIRRSYYAHQLPTRLMPPPPMQASGNGALSAAKSSTSEPVAPTYHQNYHQNMQFSSGGTPSKPYYSTAVTSPWTAAYSTHTVTHLKKPYDNRPDESINYFSVSRPDFAQSSHSNIRPTTNELKQQISMASRKPWVHHLLQKEVIKPIKSTISSTKYTMQTMKPFYSSETSIHPSRSPVTYVTQLPTLMTAMKMTTTSTTPRTTAISSKMKTTTISTPIYVSTTTFAPTVSDATTTNEVSSIKPTSSPVFVMPTSATSTYPTVAPMKLTTDSLFSHYNQPEKPFYGPMYLIIEGHSKVKTYGKNNNGTTMHEPKIVPIMAKREPIVPYDERGINFQVKHLHTKPSPTATIVTTEKTTTTTTKTTTTLPTTQLKTTIMTPSTTFEKNVTESSEPPTGMQGLLSLLDSSLGNFFLSDDAQSGGEYSKERLTSTTDRLTRPQQVAASRRSDTLPPSPREARQIFDYDQLPDSRLKELLTGDSSAVDLLAENSEISLRSSDIDDGLAKRKP